MERTLVIIKPDGVQRGLSGAILKRFEVYSESLTAAIGAAERATDMSTQDIYIEAQRQVDLHAYFLRSHLVASPR